MVDTRSFMFSWQTLPSSFASIQPQEINWAGPNRRERALTHFLATFLLPSSSSLLKLPPNGPPNVTGFPLLVWHANKQPRFLGRRVPRERNSQIKHSFILSKKVWKATKQNTTVNTKICFSSFVFACFLIGTRLKRSWIVAAWPRTKTTHDPDKWVLKKRRPEIRLRSQLIAAGETWAT